MKIRFYISPEMVESVRTWFKERGGCLLWHDLNITMSPRPDILTPKKTEDGEDVKPPYWSHGNPEEISPEEICVRTEWRLTEKGPTVSIRKSSLGFRDISETGKKRAREAAKSIGQDVLWTWDYVGYGKAVIRFYREKLEPFTLE